MRILPVRSADVCSRAPDEDLKTHRRADRIRNERERLPLWHLLENKRRDSPGSQRRAEGVAMKKQTAQSTELDRRSFLQVTALAGGGVIIGMYVPTLAQQPQGGAAAPSAWSLAPSTYITVHPDNTFTILAKNPETGQGIRTALPQIIADEFDIDWSQVKIQQADLNPKYGQQFEGGSRAMPTNYDPMRQVGAGGRLMMVNAAADMWSVPASELTTGSGTVKHAKSNRTATYASLASRVASMTPPSA